MKKRSTAPRGDLHEICFNGLCPPVKIASTTANLDRAARGQQFHAAPWGMPS
jgi:hypothetical protein